jgi:hypothetical protein
MVGALSSSYVTRIFSSGGYSTSQLIGAPVDALGGVLLLFCVCEMVPGSGIVLFACAPHY